MRVYLDTNVIMDFLTQRDKKRYETVRKIMRAAECKQLTACASTISLSTTTYLLGLKLKEQDIHEPEKRQKIRQLLKDLTEYITAVDLSHTQFRKALGDEEFKDIEDGFQYYCALQNECNVLITLNLKDFPKTNKDIEVLEPKAFTDKYIAQDDTQEKK